MFENTESLLPLISPKADAQASLRSGGSAQPQGDGRLQAVCVGYEQESLDEMDRLLTTLGISPVARVMAASRKVNPATYIGKGKIDEVKEQISKSGVNAVIVDVELSPNQLRNLEKELNRPILDRPGVIIEIFSRHARTKESKTQVALARLQYLLPRLTHFWTHFERQRGGSTGSRGMGEKQIEVDRRLIKRRIALLQERLGDIERERAVQRAGRKDILKVALVGYTNAGKSTLLNALTQSDVRAEDKLFATLDASVRSLDPDSHPPIVVIDTVGFINHLPPSLVASFRSTLEELEEADLLLHVVDASHPQAREQFDVTEDVLKELQVDGKPRITVLNKADQLTSPVDRIRAKSLAPGAIAISALNAQEVRKLRDQILGHFHSNLELIEVLVPYTDGKLESQLYSHGSVEIQRHMEKGTFYRVRMEKGWAQKLGLEKYRL